MCWSVYCSGRWTRYSAPTAAQQLRLLPELRLRLLQRVLALVQSGEHRPAADGEVAPGQLVAELLRVLRHEPLRAQLGVDVPHARDLVEVCGWRSCGPTHRLGDRCSELLDRLDPDDPGSQRSGVGSQVERHVGTVEPRPGSSGYLVPKRWEPRDSLRAPMEAKPWFWRSTRITLMPSWAMVAISIGSIW